MLGAWLAEVIIFCSKMIVAYVIAYLLFGGVLNDNQRN